MLKKVLTTLIIFSGMAAFGAENYLNTVVISNNDGKTSIVLRSDETAKVKKEVESSDKVILTLKGISQAPDINTLYKNTYGVRGLMVQNEGANGLKIYVEAPDISKADVVFETPNSAPVVVSDSISEERVIWSVISIVLLLIVMTSAKNITAEPVQQDINEIIKEREKALYRNFQREVASIPGINNYKLKAYRKHVLKGETIRSYQNFSKVGAVEKYL